MMNLDDIAPCPGCGLSEHRTAYHDAPETPCERPAAGELLLNVWTDGAWFLHCGACSYEWDTAAEWSGEDAPALPTYRNLSPEMALEIERLRAENGRLRNLLRIPPSEVPK
jgi:hypothetical protein